MRNFIKKTSLFLFVSIAIIALFIFTIHYLVDANSNFKIREDYDYLIFGNSHSECAFNDSVITNFKNLSSSGETYFYTFQKVKKILSQNKQLNSIFIEYANIQIDSEMDNWTWGYDQMSGKFPVYSPFMNIHDLQLLYKNNSKDFFSVLSKSTRENFINIVKFDYGLSDKHGGFLPLKVSKIDSLLKLSGNLTDGIDEGKPSISIVNIEYLMKIIEYCNDNKVRIYLVRSPQHKNTTYLKNDIEFLNIKKTKFPALEFLDFNNFPISNEEFADFGHLNKKGAEKFSIWFNSLLNSGLLSMENKQKYINQSIADLRKENVKEY